MLSHETIYLVNKEQHQDRLREIEHQRLIKTIEPHNRISMEWPGKVINWVGAQMVRWGAKLQSYNQASPITIDAAGVN